MRQNVFWNVLEGRGLVLGLNNAFSYMRPHK